MSIEATAALVLKALAQNPGTIVIDALDELRPDDRHELWDCLDNIVRDSPNVVKVFLTSRDDGDIVCRLSSTPNIYISVQDNQSDIERFTEQELDAAIARKRLLRGLVSEQLRWKIFTALNQGSQGMQVHEPPSILESSLIITVVGSAGSVYRFRISATAGV